MMCAGYAITQICSGVTEAVGNARIEDLLEVFSRDREGRTQSIVEIKL